MATTQVKQKAAAKKKKDTRPLEEIKAELIEKGTKQSYLSYQEINKALPDGLPTKEFEDIINELMEKNVELIDDDEARLDKKLPVAEEKKKKEEEKRKESKEKGEEKKKEGNEKKRKEKKFFF
eukprot:Anaeramoba_ignava/a224060_6.p1 GENE.a224060_6~~a224060_6.p1  ORF type:complete len:123 (-),score=28.57 a224060_6:83-451(-)